MLVLAGGIALGVAVAGLEAEAEGTCGVGHATLLDSEFPGPGVILAMTDKCTYRSWQGQRRKGVWGSFLRRCAV